MHHLNIHWKGRPHHRLPRIRVASVSSHSRSFVHIAAENALKRPLGSHLQRERRKHIFRFGRRRRSRSSRSSSSAIQARKRASLRARQYIQAFGWSTPQAELASKTSKITLARQPPNPAPARAEVNSILKSSPQNTETTTVIDSNDGAASSLIRRIKAHQPENRYSLMQVAEDPDRWTSDRLLSRKGSSIASNHSRPSRRLGGEYAHVASFRPVSRRSAYFSPDDVGRRRTYDPRIDPANRIKDERRTKSTPAHRTQFIPTRKRRGTLDPTEKVAKLRSPAFRKAVKSFTLPSKEATASAASIKSVIQTILSDAPSRTRSQRRALNHFTKELELYLQAAKSLPKKSLIPSPSATTISAHTVEELRPYRSQFEAAGLAVTSSEQQNSFAIGKLKKSSIAPSAPPKENMWTSGKSKAGPANPSFSSGTTVMGWTPPHEAPRKPRSQRTSYTLSSDHTVMAFTPPHEATTAQPKPAPPEPNRAPPAPRVPAKKSLPWLRQAGSSPEGPPSPTTKREPQTYVPPARTEDRRVSEGSIIPSLAMDLPATPKEYEQAPEARARPSEVRWNDLKYSAENLVNQIATTSKGYADASTQAKDLFVKNTSTNREIMYVDAIAQTISESDQLNGPVAVQESPIVQNRAQMTTGRSKTFPLNPQKCEGDCRETLREVGTKVPRSSIRPKPYVDQATQTTIVQENPMSAEVITPYEKRPPFKSTILHGERTWTLPSQPATMSHPIPYRPFKATMALRSPQKRADDVETRKMSREPLEDRTIPSPTRPAPSPPILPELTFSPWTFTPVPELQGSPSCEEEALNIPSAPDPATSLSRYLDAEVRPSVLARDLPSRAEPPPPQFRDERESPRRRALNYSCTARSSLECAQCELPKDVIPTTLPECAPPRAIADPEKKPLMQRLRMQPDAASHTPVKHTHVKHSAPLPPLPLMLDAVLPASETVSTSCSVDPGYTAKISDRAVFRGLHVATAAACDEDVDKWIEEITGTGVRRFLADLNAFEGLGFNTLAAVARRAAKQRRDQVKAWERIREQRLKELGLGEERNVLFDSVKGTCMDRKAGLVPSDESVRLKDQERLDSKGEPARDHAAGC